MYQIVYKLCDGLHLLCFLFCLGGIEGDKIAKTALGIFLFFGDLKLLRCRLEILPDESHRIIFFQQTVENPVDGMEYDTVTAEIYRHIDRIPAERLLLYGVVEHLYLSTLKGIDGLLAVADDEEVFSFSGVFDDLILEQVGILKLIDHNIAVIVLYVWDDLGCSGNNGVEVRFILFFELCVVALFDLVKQ